MAGTSSIFWTLDGGLYALQKMGSAGNFMESSHALTKGKYFAGENSIHGQHRRPGAQTCSRGLKKRAIDQALGRSRGGLGTKLHLLVDKAQRLIYLSLSPSQASDHSHAPVLIEQAASEKKLKILCGDKGYDSEKLRMKIRESGMRPVIPKRGNSLQSPDFCHEIYKQRNMIERFIGKLKENRRIATRYDKTASNYEAFIHLAAIKNWLKIIC